MRELQLLFPPTDFALLAVIVGLPLIGALANGIFGRRVGKQAVSLMALTSVGVSFLASVIAFGMLMGSEPTENALRFVWKGWHWINVSGRMNSGQIPLEVALSIDALSGAMALIVTGVGFVIHLYSTKYMDHDPGYHRYFAYLNLFIFSMLVLILGDNLPVLFVGWEGVGLCSYLLIGFWFEDDRNATAGKKAFITNRIGDVGLLIAMALLIYFVGALDWTGIEARRVNLLQAVQVWPIGTHVPIASILPNDAEQWVNTPRYVSAATLVGLALFLGCVGKSAQIPLYVWLPDAMAGPTPVSALIHAATMVTAGVYLVCRMAGVFVLSPAAMFTVAIVGAVTAVFAATIAVVQNDIKKVLAYSTVSQLGYMFLGVGVGAFAAGFFHVLTHAFFKACLFLGAGSVIHAMHARIHDTDASQDMRNMGGLKRFMPLTFWTFVAAWAAIVGFPLTSGFFSKDEILHQAYASFIGSPISSGVLTTDTGQMELFRWPEWGPYVLYGLGVTGAVLTAFYMTRLVIGIFYGEFRGWTIVRRWKPAGAHGDVAHAHAAHVSGEPLEGPKPHESPWQMTAPLVILGGLSLVAGLLNAHLFHFTWVDSWLEPVFRKAGANVEQLEAARDVGPMLLGVAVFVFAVGFGAAYWVYVAMRGQPARELREGFPGLYRLVYQKWKIDELYEETIIGAVDALGEVAVWFDRWVVDGILARLTSGVVALSGSALRYAQTGRVQSYAAVMVLGVLGLGWYLVLPHAKGTLLSDHRAGTYTVDAASGLGYQYRWDANGDGKWDSEEYGDQRKVAFNLGIDEKRTVRLEVKNAFGRTASRDFDLERPKPDLSGAPAILDVQKSLDGVLRAIPRGQGQPGDRPPAGVQPQPMQPQPMQPQPMQPQPMPVQPRQFPGAQRMAPPAGAQQPRLVAPPALAPQAPRAPRQEPPAAEGAGRPAPPPPGQGATP